MKRCGFCLVLKAFSNFIWRLLTSFFDTEEFYPSISQDLFNKTLDFASAHDNITADERNIIHAKNSILIHKQQPWQKKGNTTFDVTMGSFDGAKTCELVGSFLLSQLQHLNINVGLYRDDGLAITNSSLVISSSDVIKASLTTFHFLSNVCLPSTLCS